MQMTATRMLASDILWSWGELFPPLLLVRPTEKLLDVRPHLHHLFGDGIKSVGIVPLEVVEVTVQPLHPLHDVDNLDAEIAHHGDQCHADQWHRDVFNEFRSRHFLIGLTILDIGVLLEITFTAIAPTLHEIFGSCCSAF